MSNDAVRFVASHGNIRDFVILFRVKGSKTLWDITGATVHFEWSTSEGEAKPPIVVDSSLGDWANGIVRVRVTGSDVTANPGTYPFSLTVALDGTVITALTGYVEVRCRPGYPFPPAAPVVTSSLSMDARLGVLFYYQIFATHLPSSFGATGLPPGLSLNSATGVISGIPATAGTYTVTIQATNAGGTSTATLVVSVVDVP